MINEMLRKENIRILNHALDWKKAIQYCVQPLVDTNYVESRYADEIINNTLQLGAYYVIAKDLALVHGSSNQGVIAKQLAVVVSKEEIVFPENKRAKLLVVLAAEDGESHMTALSKLAKIFMDAKRIEKICGMENVDDIYNEFLRDE